VLTKFFADGKAAGERLVYAAPAGDEHRLVEYLWRAGHEPHELVRRGQLVLTTVEEAYLPAGHFDAARRLAEYEQQVHQALADGFSGLRVAGEAATVASHPAVDGAWEGFELRADLMAARLSFVGLCGYDLRDCAGVDLEVVRAVHRKQLDGEDERERMFRLYALGEDVLALEGEVDLTSAEKVRGLLSEVRHDMRSLRLDVSRLAFIDVSGVRALADVAREAAQSAPSRICGSSPTFKKVWSLLGFDQIEGVKLNGCEAPV
jgi:anti-anti-sigma factor